MECQSLSLSGGATLPAFDQDWPAAVWSFLLGARVRLQRLDTGEIYYGDHKVVVWSFLFEVAQINSPQVSQLKS